ncbi:hypothetical protein CHCC20335_3154 [Bacillus paralicheniformis]|nr:hypothetical protein CHCC20335_3154 [Bacillus paralicheniformis]
MKRILSSLKGTSFGHNKLASGMLSRILYAHLITAKRKP